MINSPQNRQKVLFSFVFAVAAIFIFGYQFNNGDQEEHLPYVYRLIDNSLYTNDYIVPLQTTQFTIRFYFAWFIYFLSKLFTVEYSVFGVHFICLMIINWSVTSMALRRSQNNWPLLITPVFICVLNNLPVGGNGLLDIQLTCTMPAVALGLFALNQFDAGHIKFAFLLTGFAACFQVLIGLHLAVLLLLCAVFLRGVYSFKTILTSFFLFLLTAGPMLFPVLQRQFTQNTGYNHDEYFNILFLLRNSNHYAPQCFDSFKMILFIVVAVLSLYMLLRKKRNKYEFLHLMILFILCGCILYSAGFIVFRSESIAKTQWFKTPIWVYYAAAILFSDLVSSKIKYKVPSNRLAVLSLSSSVVVLLLVFNSAVVPIGKFHNRYKIGNYKKTELQLIHEWINKNLPKHAQVISFPGDDSFLCEAKRSMPVGYKAIIHEPGFIIPWHEKLKLYYNISIEDFECNKSMVALADSNYQHADYKDLPTSHLPDYRLIQLHGDSRSMDVYGKLIVRFGNYILFKIK